MKDDVVTPARPPRKRRALQRASDRDLAVWASDENVPEAEREFVQAERDRRKAERRREPRIAGVLVGQGGASPDQVAALSSLLASASPTEVHHPYCQPSVHQACRSCGAEVSVWRGSSSKFVAKAVDRLYGLVNESTVPSEKTGVWRDLRHAKDRGVEVVVVWPNGGTLEGRW